MTIEFTVPVRIESEMNRREHWSVRKRRFDSQRQMLWLTGWCSVHTRDRLALLSGSTYTVTLTRIAPRRLDDDNAASGAKACRDEIAKWLTIDDGDSRIEWRYAQRKGKPKEYALHVRIEAAS